MDLAMVRAVEPSVRALVRGADHGEFLPGNLAAGRYRVALFGALERVKDSEWDACEEAYLAGASSLGARREGPGTATADHVSEI